MQQVLEAARRCMPRGNTEVTENSRSSWYRHGSCTEWLICCCVDLVYVWSTARQEPQRLSRTDQLSIIPYHPSTLQANTICHNSGFNVIPMGSYISNRPTLPLHWPLPRPFQPSDSLEVGHSMTELPSPWCRISWRQMWRRNCVKSTGDNPTTGAPRVPRLGTCVLEALKALRALKALKTPHLCAVPSWSHVLKPGQGICYAQPGWNFLRLTQTDCPLHLDCMAHLNLGQFDSDLITVG